MMSRLLKRAAAAAVAGANSQTNEEDSAPRSTTPSKTPAAPATSELETKLTQVMRELRETQSRLFVLEQQNNGGELPPWVSHIDAAMQNQKEAVETMANTTNQSLQFIVSQSEQLSARLAKTEMGLQMLNTTSKNR